MISSRIAYVMEDGNPTLACEGNAIELLTACANVIARVATVAGNGIDGCVGEVERLSRTMYEAMKKNEEEAQECPSNESRENSKSEMKPTE